MQNPIPAAFFAALAIALIVWKLRQRRLTSRTNAQTAAEDCARYSHLTQQMLSGLAEEELMRAVICNLQSKMAPDRSDAFAVVSKLSLERQAVYLIYAVTRAVNYSGFSALKKSGGEELLPLCASALHTLGLQNAADLMLQAASAPQPDRLRAAYLRAFNRQGGPAKMAAYIRQRAAAFCDAPA